MTAQEHIQSALGELKQPLNLEKPSDNELVEAIFKLVMSKKFRKYSCKPELIQQIRTAIELNVKKQEPIKFTFLHGAYKLWRLEEAPEADWAELFSAMYYTKWLKPICEIYEPGVWFDYFVDDLILPKIHTSSLENMRKYLASYRQILDFLKQYQPKNYKMTITGVGDQFSSPEAFDEKLQSDIKRQAATLPKGVPELSQERIAMIDLNTQPTAETISDPKWREKNALVHDAYIGFTKRETNYHWQQDKIKVFTQPLASGTVIAVGSTKDSVMKFWVGVGVLRPKDGGFRQIILSPSQLEKVNYSFQDIEIVGLDGKNFNKIRVLNEKRHYPTW